MVKGVTRQVILVDSPDRGRFERAIFILRDGRSERPEELLAEAQSLAEKGMGGPGLPPRRLHPLVWLLLGAAGTGIVWLLVSLL